MYAGLASGRVVVIGAPGAGKTGTAILLLLDALAHRDRLDDPQRARVPVPILLTAHGWDPATCSVRDWLRDQLTVTYPLFQSRGGRTEAEALLNARDKVALILDGLDEIDQTLRPAALQALSDAPFRVIVLTRSQEMIHATSRTWLTGAIAVQLHHVSVPDAADYLQRARTGPPPAGWTELLDHLREHPDSVLSRGLSTPLTLTLLRDTYQTGDDVRALIDPTRYSTTDAIEEHLITRVLPAAYTPRPGRPPPRYTELQARQALSFIARKMGTNRDFAWWHIPHWASTTLRVLAGGIVIGLSVGLVAGLVVGPVVGLAGGLSMGLGLGLLSGLTVGLHGGLNDCEHRRVRMPNGRAAALPSGLVVVVMVAPGLWLALGVMLAFKDEFTGVLAVAVAVEVARQFKNAITEPGAGAGQPMDPRQVWHNDRSYGLVVGLGGGLVIGLTFGLASGLTFVLAGGLTFGLAGGLTFGLADGLGKSQAWWTSVVWLQLRLSRQVPAVRLLAFLEDARARDILRTVGAVYQFRHAKLQDQLSDEVNAHHPTSAVQSSS